ncbi:MAG: hypothetical protein U0136_21415 [Bdellovibrionota bacterium]
MKKIVSFFALLVAVWFLCELVSFVGLMAIHRGAPDFAELQKARDTLLGNVEKSPQQALFELPAALHPYLGTVHNPDADIPAEYHAGFHVNDYGFFDDKEPIQRKRKGRFVLGIFGGSVAWWLSTLGSQPLIDELKKSPYFHDKEIVIVRTALGAYREPQQLASLYYLLTLGAQFDAIVNLDGFNEMTLPLMHNVPKGVFPIYPTYWNDILEPIISTGTQEWIGKLAFMESIRKSGAAFASRPVLRMSPTVNLVWELFERVLGAKLSRLKLEHQQQKAGSAKLPYSIRGSKFHSGSEAEISQDLAGYWRRASVLMDAAAKSKGIEYFHFLQPNQYVPGSKPISEAEKKIAIDPTSDWKRLVELGYPLLEKEIPRLQAAGVRFYDLTKVFEKDQTVLYNDNCCHLNLDGNAVLARAIARPIVETYEKKGSSEGSDQDDN